MNSLQEKVPHFEAVEFRSQKLISLYDLLGDRALLMLFFPWPSNEIEQLKSAIKTFSEDVIPKGMRMTAILSTLAQKEAQEFAHQSDWQFPILNDKDNSIKNSFGAHSSTPEFFLYDQRGHLLTHQTLTLPNLTTGARHLFPEKVPY